MRSLVAIAAGGLLILLVAGVVRAQRSPTGRVSGAAEVMLSAKAQYLVAAAFFATSLLLWRPIRVDPTPATVSTLELIGGIVALAGIGLASWARLKLGALYDVSSAAGARLRADHRLVTSGPFGMVRHPMYVGIEVAALGSILVYRTWTTVFLAIVFLGLSRRARQEDLLLEAEFGDQWRAYASDVPAWLPRLAIRRPTRTR